MQPLPHRHLLLPARQLQLHCMRCRLHHSGPGWRWCHWLPGMRAWHLQEARRQRQQVPSVSPLRCTGPWTCHSVLASQPATGAPQGAAAKKQQLCCGWVASSTDVRCTCSDCSCPSGYQTDVNGTGATACTPCPKGHYRSSPGTALCLPCPPSTYSDGSSKPAPRPARACMLSQPGPNLEGSLTLQGQHAAKRDGWKDFISISRDLLLWLLLQKWPSPVPTAQLAQSRASRPPTLPMQPCGSARRLSVHFSAIPARS